MSEPTRDGKWVPPRPWRLEPLAGKFYGTTIVDAEGNSVCDIWLTAGPPSPREDMEPEDVCDSHYESMATWQTATLICDLANAADVSGRTYEREGEL